jgi:hypothetical protein
MEVGVTTMRRLTAIFVFVCLLATLLASGASIRSPYRRHLRRAHLRVSHWHPILRGSHDSLVRQNEEIDRLRLTRIADDQELEELEMRGDLVGIHESRALEIAPNLELNRRFCRPWTRDFLEDLSEAFYSQFHHPIEVTSAVRTVEQQARLQRSNGNAAPIDGDTASSHLAGLTVDIGKRPMNRRERAWVSQYVLRLQELGLVEAAEERRQACFHIMVSNRYDEYRGSPDQYASSRAQLVGSSQEQVPAQ